MKIKVSFRIKVSGGIRFRISFRVMVIDSFSVSWYVRAFLHPFDIVIYDRSNYKSIE